MCAGKVDNLNVSILLIDHQMSCVVARTLKIQDYFKDNVFDEMCDIIRRITIETIDFTHLS